LASYIFAKIPLLLIKNISMIFPKNLNNIAVLQTEIARLKSQYIKALETNKVSTLQAIRKKIKLLNAKINVMK
jgi:hypothetical protein